MANFKVGDMCVIVQDAYPEKLRGMECVIDGPEDWYHANLSAGKPGPTFAYRVILAGETWYAQRNALQRKRPPSWDKWIYGTSDLTTDREVSA